jgi:5-methylcytosine-specific restriction endonuclease McrA
MRKNALPFDCTKDDLKDIFLMFDNRCAYCGAEGPLALEHVVPVSRIDVENPGTVRGNLMPLCRACNSSKGVRTIDEYFANEKLVRAEVVKFARGRGMGLYDLLVSLKFKMDLLRR